MVLFGNQFRRSERLDLVNPNGLLKVGGDISMVSFLAAWAWTYHFASKTLYRTWKPAARIFVVKKVPNEIEAGFQVLKSFLEPNDAFLEGSDLFLINQAWIRTFWYTLSY